MSIVAKLGRGAKFMSDLRAWPFMLQRQFKGRSSRERMANLVAKSRPRPRFQSALDVQLKQKLDKDGIAHLGQLLSTEQVDEIRNWLSQRLIIDEYRPETPAFLPLGSGRHPDSHVAYHYAADVIAAPHLLALANRPELLAIAEAFLGCRPTIGYLAAWWSYPTTVGAQQAENFHRDVDDWRFLKLFVYLTDVGPDNGPHIYVTQSALKDELRELRRFEDAEVFQTFGSDKILVNEGNAGSGFFENTSGIHKGQPVKSGKRLMFQAVYSLNPLPYGPKSAAARLSDIDAGLDPFVNRVYLSS
jgi:Phytanoyl-CoA dioxygenase (PhyH)